MLSKIWITYFKLFSMNTFFRVLYTIAIQWRTYLMFCGPEGGWGCVSVFSREMVFILTISYWKTMESFWRIVTWWLCLLFWMLSAALSLVFSLQQSGLSTHYESHQSFTVHLTNNSIGSFLCEAACKKKFRMCSNETHSGHNALSQD